LKRIIWGFTGSGDRTEEIIENMIQVNNMDDVQVTVVISKAGEQVLRLYKLWDKLNTNFSKVKKEVNANVPFIAGPLQIGKYDLFLVVPLTANSTAKIAHGIADTLITNAVAQTLKGTTPVLVYPVDQSSDPITTFGPDGIEFSLTPRDVDLENVTRLRQMKGLTVLEDVSTLSQIVRSFLERKEDS
jgi:archaeoflavoprotein AfpA